MDNPNRTPGKAKVKMPIKGYGIPPVKLTVKGMPSVDEDSLSILAGSPSTGKYGKAYEYFAAKGNPEFGKEVCNALALLI